MPTKIEWAEETWNPVTGCSPVSEGCRNCYAKRMAQRLRGRCGYPEDEPFKVTFHPNQLRQPSRWKKPRRVFVCSMGDLFHDDVPERWISAVFLAMQKAKKHTFLILTKRPERMAEFLDRWGHCDNDYPEDRGFLSADCSAGKPLGYGHYRREGRQRDPLSNVWLGVTAENQEQADRRIPILLSIPAAVRFVSVEPMLGPVDIEEYFPKYDYRPMYGYYREFLRMQRIESDGKPVLINPGIDWVICGGESGPGARPMHPDWARCLKDQCQTAGVSFYFKQHGEWRECEPPDQWDSARYKITDAHRVHFVRLGKKAAGRLLDGREWNEYPEVGVTSDAPR